jgi:anti-sigma factor RsiW
MRWLKKGGLLVRYEDVADLLPGLVDGTVDVDARTRSFIESDLRCQAELARYRRLLRGLGALRTAYLEPAPGSLAQTLNALAAEGERRVARSILTGRRVAMAGAALGGAAVAGAATAAVLAARTRRRVLAG